MSHSHAPSSPSAPSSTSSREALWSPCEPPSLTSGSISALRARLEPRSLQELMEGFRALSPWMRHPQLRRGLLQVAYQAELLSAEAGELHAQFQREHPRCSTYLPLCLPGLHSEGLRDWATPQACHACLFREAGRCDGLGVDGLGVDELSVEADDATFSARQWSVASAQLAGGALLDPWSIETGHNTHGALTSKPLLEGAQPLAYWAPEPELTQALEALMKAHQAEVFWDVGAGNGLLGEVLCPSWATLVSVEPITLYQLPPRARAWRGDASSALQAALTGALPSPDVLLISWPSPGRSYRALIEALQPKLILRAYDEAGFCGARQSYRAVVWREGTLQWWRATDTHDGYDDASPPQGYERLWSREVESLFDARARLQTGEREGRVSLDVRLSAAAHDERLALR